MVAKQFYFTEITTFFYLLKIKICEKLVTISIKKPLHLKNYKSYACHLFHTSYRINLRNSPKFQLKSVEGRVKQL